MIHVSQFSGVHQILFWQDPDPIDIGQITISTYDTAEGFWEIPQYLGIFTLCLFRVNQLTRRKKPTRIRIFGC